MSELRLWSWSTARRLVYLESYRPPAGPLVLAPGVTVTDPARFVAALRADVAEGPDGPRARLGTLQSDLRRLLGA